MSSNQLRANTRPTPKEMVEVVSFLISTGKIFAMRQTDADEWRYILAEYIAEVAKENPGAQIVAAAFLLRKHGLAGGKQ